MRVFYRKIMLMFVMGSALLFSGCGTTAPAVEDDSQDEIVAEDTPKDAENGSSIEIEKDEEKQETAAPAVVEKKESAAVAPKPGTTDQIPVTLVSTTDGDTIRIMYNGKNEAVRYLLIDTPETSHPRLGKQPFGPEAKERNRALVNSGKLTIEFDIGEKRDKYDRLLAYVYVDGKSVQETLLTEGLARVAYVYPPNTRHLTPYEKAQQEAKNKKRGIWSVEDYATDSGFASESAAPAAQVQPTPKQESIPASTVTGASEVFDNCTHLRTKYPEGVPSTHPAYQAKMDRDKDNYACER